jgi:ornithine cyclodeaminase/alanine dehydrogenase-like protein (mu-crystallin family)
MYSTVVGKESLRAILTQVGVDRFMDETIDELTAALRQFDPRRTELLPRAGFAYQTPRPGVFEWMPIMQVAKSVLVKLVAYNPQNPDRGRLPTIMATLALFDAQTGHLTALTDGLVPTAVRTGAASAVASRILASPDSRTLGLVGCGAQAVTQLHALSRVFPLEQVLVYDVDPLAAESFLQRAAFVPVGIKSVSLAQLEENADIICTATSVAVGAGPVIVGDRLRACVHINAIGSDLPGKTELPLQLLRRSLVCCDYRAQALVEGEAQQLSPDDLGPSLVELVQNPACVRPDRSRPTVFDSTGYALEDLVVLKVLLRHAEALGLGQRLEIEAIPPDPKNPYSCLGMEHLRALPLSPRG